MPGLPFLAALRVYEPVEALGPEFADWADRLGSPQADPNLAPALEREAALRRMVAVPPLPAPTPEPGDLLLINVDGRQLGAPTRVSLRCWKALEDLRKNTFEPLLGAFFPRSTIDQAGRDFAAWRAANPTAVPHIRSRPWQVPLSWFAPFSAADREAVASPAASRTRYRTPLPHARRRVARSLTVLRRTLSEDPLVEAVAEIGRWLECFHPDAVLELDYCGLASLGPASEGEADESAAEVQRALAALAASDAELAVQTYARLVKRWRCYAEYAHFS
ncbi:MAG: hypothetical protein ACT4QF_07870 [Sporichthyaceae bacterium]